MRYLWSFEVLALQMEHVEGAHDGSRVIDQVHVRRQVRSVIHVPVPVEKSERSCGGKGAQNGYGYLSVAGGARNTYSTT